MISTLGRGMTIAFFCGALLSQGALVGRLHAERATEPAAEPAVGAATEPATQPAAAASVAAENYFRIRVIDEQSGRGLPLVVLRTVDNSLFVTDSAGWGAYYEPGQMDRDVFFHVASPGYAFRADGFGFVGKSLRTTPGTTAELRIRRQQIAERVYRVTGAGIYRDSVLLGEAAPIAEPLLNAQVTGSDSVQTAIYRGELRWFWGDTNRPKYPLGLFHVPGAVSKLPAQGGLDPAVGINLHYLTNVEGFVRATAQMAGDGPTWIEGVVVVPAEASPNAREQMFCAYVKVRQGLDIYRRGLARWDDEQQVFVHVADLPLDAVAMPFGHAMHFREGDRDYVYFGNPFPLTRTAASGKALVDPGQYENFTCLKGGVRLTAKERERGAVQPAQFDRDANGKLRYAWKANTSAVDPALEQRLRRAGKLRDGEGLFGLRDPASGKPVIAHAGSVAWNEWRKRYVALFCQVGGQASYLGEIWYAEADSPTGPWTSARHVATHPKYSFYNPLHHPYFDQESGRVIYFEGTYTHTFSGSHEQTPRYDYNQIMYRLDLGDERLKLP